MEILSCTRKLGFTEDPNYTEIGQLLLSGYKSGRYYRARQFSSFYHFVVIYVPDTLTENRGEYLAEIPMRAERNNFR